MCESSSCLTSLARSDVVILCHFSHFSRCAVVKCFQFLLQCPYQVFICKQAPVLWKALFSAVTECPDTPLWQLVEVRWNFVLCAHLYRALMSGLFHGACSVCDPLCSDVQVPTSSSWAEGAEGLSSDCARVLGDAYISLCTLPSPWKCFPRASVTFSFSFILKSGIPSRLGVESWGWRPLTPSLLVEDSEVCLFKLNRGCQR